MATITLDINGQNYDVSCADGQEDHLRMLASLLSERLADFTKQFSSQVSGARLPENYLLMITALTLQDELYDLRQELEQLRNNSALVANKDKLNSEQERRAEMEQMVTATLEQITSRIERLAASV